MRLLRNVVAAVGGTERSKESLETDFEWVSVIGV